MGFAPDDPRTRSARMTEFDIATRTGLPDALRILLEKHPREGWTAHPHFDGLTRFWLERHLMFRRLQSMLIETTEGGIARRDEPQRLAATLQRLAGMFLNELHAHHTIEDMHYFPLLKRLEPRLERGFALLDSDHHALDPLLHALAERTNDALRALPEARDAMGALHDDLVRFERFLDRHLTDEEEIVVPVILEHGARLG
jgi:hemerythrin-like domain-containing protein